MKPDGNNKEMNEKGMETKYYCPMHCEEDKVYDKPGNCPVCNMKLVPVGTESHGHHH